VARTELTALGLVLLASALLCGAPARAQKQAPAVADQPAPPAPEAAATPACVAAKSYKQCAAACREMFPPKPKVETSGETVARERLAIHGWWSLGAGVALLVGGGVAGGVALHLNGELSQKCPGGSCPPEHYAELDTRDRLAVTSTVLIAGGVAASAVGILILAVFARPPKNAGDEALKPAPAVVPALGPNAAGATLAWRF
jgi:hypothetical protein